MLGVYAEGMPELYEQEDWDQKGGDWKQSLKYLYLVEGLNLFAIMFLLSYFLVCV